MKRNSFRKRPLKRKSTKVCLSMVLHVKPIFFKFSVKQLAEL